MQTMNCTVYNSIIQVGHEFASFKRNTRIKIKRIKRYKIQIRNSKELETKLKWVNVFNLICQISGNGKNCLKFVLIKYTQLSEMNTS